MGELTGGNYLYLNVSSGKLVNKKLQKSMFGYEGTLIGIKRKEDDYEGQAVMKIELKMQDNKSDTVTLISFTEESWYSQGFFARIERIDLSRPFVLGVSASEQNDKVSFCWLKQGAETIKSEKGSFPAPEKNSRGKMTYDKMLDAIEPIIKKLQDKLGESAAPETSNKMQGNPHAEKSFGGDEKPEKKGYTKQNASVVNPELDDLPF